MIITACYQPAPTATKTEQVEQCHSFSDLEHFQQWLKEKGFSASGSAAVYCSDINPLVLCWKNKLKP
jgi:hypothetical protein